jgi:hypothetical protein
MRAFIYQAISPKPTSDTTERYTLVSGAYRRSATRVARHRGVMISRFLLIAISKTDVITQRRFSMSGANFSPEQQAALVRSRVANSHDYSAGLFSLYWRSFSRALARQVWLGWWGHSSSLVSLTSINVAQAVTSIRSAGIVSVPIADIIGSENRCNDFDNTFLPLQTRTWDRWRSIAIAWRRDIVLPPVELIQVGTRYFVRDGHHRLSVAAVFGQADIDANVVVWELTNAAPMP